MMRSTLLFFALFSAASTEAFAPASFARPVSRRSPAPLKAMNPLTGAAAAAILSLQLATTPMVLPDIDSFSIQNTPITVAATETREGIYKSYDIETKAQDVDDAKGTFKTAKATAKGKSKYVGILGVLIIGSFIIPMAQYFWYVREE
mmetsp:Transcript_65634/g.132073  ORF Transcript_65634/g.132073 Transcript_65634/m.132073 type:complete len:147 (-) Transcript_65634:226-666(-)